jgi:hypothetical protein
MPALGHKPFPRAACGYVNFGLLSVHSIGARTEAKTSVENWRRALEFGKLGEKTVCGAPLPSCFAVLLFTEQDVDHRRRNYSFHLSHHGVERSGCVSVFLRRE